MVILRDESRESKVLHSKECAIVINAPGCLHLLLLTIFPSLPRLFLESVLVCFFEHHFSVSQNKKQNQKPPNHSVFQLGVLTSAVLSTIL